MTTNDDTVTRATAELVKMLASKDAIRELTGHYARGVIFGDGEALAALLHERHINMLKGGS